jgi:signal transduction histidine kinase
MIQWWQRLGFPEQFAALASIFAIPALLGLGLLLHTYFSRVAIDNAAAIAAINLDGEILPYADEIASGKPLSENTLSALTWVMNTGWRKGQVLSIKIWRPNGDIIYSTQESLIGKNFPDMEDLGVALRGSVKGDLNDPEPENVFEQRFGVPLFEVYSPIRDKSNQQVIGVAEVYLDGTALQNAIRSATRDIWIVAALSAFAFSYLLSLVVRRAARTIVAQNSSLDQKVVELSAQLKHNQDLSRDLRAAHQRFANITEQSLRQAGSDIHDGPVQLLALLALRLPSLKPKGEDSKLHADLTKLADTAMRDLRRVASGLVIPQFEGMTLHQVVEMAIHDHEIRTHTNVERAFEPCVTDCPEVVKVSAYRIVQESLTNAVKHAGGVGQCVELVCTPDIDIQIMDRGPGMRGNYNPDSLGLRGMQARMEAIGGTLSLQAREGGGTIVHAHLAGRRLPELIGLKT